MVATAIFLVTYAIVAFNRFPGLRLDRSGAAVVGAVAMVAAGVLPLEAAWRAINHETLLILLGMMVLNVFLEDAGFFEWVAGRILARAVSPTRMLVELAAVSGLLSALFLNDTVCLMLTPPLVRILRAGRLPLAPFLITLAMSANAGSVLTLTGNPQNMLIGVYSGWSYLAFLGRMLLPGVVSLAILAVWVVWWYRRELVMAADGRAGPSRNRDREDAGEDKSKVRESGEARPVLLEGGSPAGQRPIDVGLLRKTLVVLAGTLIGFLLHPDLPLVAMTGAAVLLVWSGRSPTAVLHRVNWVLLAFFAGLFVVVEGFRTTGVLERLNAIAGPWYGTTAATQVPLFGLVTVVASNVVSNVPFVVLMEHELGHFADPPLMWLVLALASTLAGNLTIPGSVATLIVLEQAGPEARVSFREFSAVGVPVTVLSVVVGLGLLMLV